jgi:hypothetical protein
MKRVISHQWSVISGQWSGVSKQLGLITVYCSLITLLPGCASINQSLRTETRGTNGIVEIKETRSRALAIWDAKQTIERLRVSNGKTHSVGLHSGENEASSTNTAASLRALTDLLNALKP